jgi:ribonuclease P protein component
MNPPRPDAQPRPLPSFMPSTRLTFRARHRLTHALQFGAVFDAGVSKARGPFIVFAKPNALPHPRLGLSVSKAVGNAVERNRIKRAIREAFRHLQHEFPLIDACSFDFVVRARKHQPLTPEQYIQSLRDAAASLDREWRKRARKSAP